MARRMKITAWSKFCFFNVSMQCENHHSSEQRTFSGYKLLVQHIALLEGKLVELGTPELGDYFREVSI